MIPRETIHQIASNYDPGNIAIGFLGGHSGLDVGYGAKKNNFRTVAVCQKGREKTYSKYFRSRDGKGCIDEIILVDRFGDIVEPAVVKRLQELNTVFIHNRYFWVYCDYNRVEEDFAVPIFGTRPMVKLEERDVPGNQYTLLEAAGIRFPKIFASPEEIDRLVIVKASEKIRGYERAFFLANSAEDYRKKGQELVAQGLIDEESLTKAVIEEYAIGAQVNLNYFYSIIDDELELMGTDTRRQTNLDGFLRLTADQQLEVLQYLRPKMIETGHIAVTTKESIIEKIFTLGERFVAVTKERVPPGIIGPFALQGTVVAEEGREEIVIFDVSLRIPGSPLTMFTPHTAYLYGQPLSYGERIAMEIRKAVETERLPEIVT